MSTPTPSNVQTGRQPNQLQAPQAVLAASTASPNFSSPAAMPPRSVPSPAAHRLQAGRSPLNPGGIVLTNNAMNNTSAAAGMPPGATHANLSATVGASSKLLGSSPAGILPGFDSPAALGLSLSQFGTLEGGVGMGISMSGISALGLGGSSMGGRGDDEERRKRLEAVLAKLRVKNGRVSEEGVERLSRKMGLEALWEDRRKDGTKVLSIAGQTMLIDITFRAAEVENVTLALPSTSPIITSYAEPVGKILEADLRRPSDTPAINFKLDRFAKNLERLSKLDRLSSAEVNCFEALSGLYNSMRRLFDHEKRMALKEVEADKNHREVRAEREVLCKRSGRPNLHGHGTAGLTLDYWMDQRHIFHKKQSGTGVQPPEAIHFTKDAKARFQSKHSGEIKENQVYSLSIECEPCSSDFYPPVRVSDHWVSQSSGLMPDDMNNPSVQPTLEWLEPPPTYTSMNSNANNDNPEADAMVLDPPKVGKLPNVRFVAKVDPPIALPLQLAMQIMHDAQADVPSDSILPTTFDGLLVEPRNSANGGESASSSNINGEIKTINRVKRVPVMSKEGEQTGIDHAYTLFVPKPEYGRMLEQIPFSHPRQLIQVLPILRQYALLNSLLKTAISDTDVENSDTKENPNNNLKTENSASSAPQPVARLQVDLTLINAFQGHSLGIAYPIENKSYKKSSMTQEEKTRPDQLAKSVAYFGIQVMQNGELDVTGQTLAASSARIAVKPKASNAEADDVLSNQKIELAKKLAESLDIYQELGAWIELLREQGISLP